MSEFAKMDLFFFITSVATVILTILLVIVLVYLIRFLRDLKHISKQAKIETDNLKQDMDDLRHSVRNEGLKFKQVISFFNNIFKRYKKGK